jgi:hypothetical protein
MRVARGDTAGGGEAGIGGRASAEEDFKPRIVLVEEGFEMSFEVGLVSVERLEQGNGSRRPGGRAFGAMGVSITSGAEKADETCDGEDRRDGRSTEPEDADVEEDSKDHTIGLRQECRSCTPRLPLRG